MARWTGERRPIMRLVRYNTPNRVLPGMLDRSGALRDLSYVLIDILPENFSPVDIDILYSIEPDTLPPVSGEPVFEAPIAETGQIFIGDAHTSDIRVIGPNADVYAPEGPILAGIAHIVGAPGWSGAQMAAMTDPAAGWLALGPIISTIKAVTHDLPLAAANQGDIVFRGGEVPRDPANVTFTVDGLGQQRHACNPLP